MEMELYIKITPSKAFSEIPVFQELGYGTM